MTKRAALFPGQGSQFVGMGKVFRGHTVGASVFDAADTTLGFSLSSICFEGPTEELTLTQNAQPALVAHSYATLQSLRQFESDSKQGWTAVAGHSLGEWSALVAAGAMPLEAALKLVHLRGKLMQKAVPAGVGAMSALIGLEAAVVEQICQDAAGSEVVSPATYNGNGQIVVSGHAAAVERAEVLAIEAGALKVMRLEVSAPFHCALMEPAMAPLREALEATEISPPLIPVCSTVDLSWPAGPADICRVLVEQLIKPTRWDEAVRAVVGSGADELHVIGAAKSLARTVKRLRTGATVVARTEGEFV
ncbi:MAG: [acyl-carrier-protein] S-malonyltransferase [Bradymonadia bacterium]|jgi:[acyl-carrier-protein] S-malonyltransferase